MTVEKPKPKQLLRPISTGTNSAVNQRLAITCNSLEAREKSRVPGAIGFGFASHWLKNWRESLRPINKRSSRNDVVTFDSHLKTALSNHEAYFITTYSSFSRFARRVFAFVHFVAVCVLSTAWNDLFCRCLDDLDTGPQVFHFFF